MSDLKRKQEINETYSQGATNILNYSYQDNCEKAYPAEIEFFLDDDVFHVNTVELTFKTKRYRGYTKAVKEAELRLKVLQLEELQRKRARLVAEVSFQVQLAEVILVDPLQVAGRQYSI